MGFCNGTVAGTYGTCVHSTKKTKIARTILRCAITGLFLAVVIMTV